MIKSIRLEISGMHCTSCAINIDGELEDMNGVKSANTNYARSHTDVEFDENVLSDEEIIKMIKKVGYEAAIAK